MIERKVEWKVRHNNPENSMVAYGFVWPDQVGRRLWWRLGERGSQ